ncbi:Crp/Fnr family transcriptional regulator [Sedimentibacter saalensis]|uniref:Crp/Fnr family transcriptional regulator n=1 Tax=Sedimentibacter saalensis TaxID=130788 RepID=UPI0028980F19|nr:Crp/Fnr family transcriptional regulator [Sedimentibacter saalensis]
MKINIQNKAEQAPITLSNLKLFEAFSIDELKDFLESSKCEIREFSKDEITHFQNETCRFMEIILEGRVLVQNIDEDGNVLTIETFVNGDIIGANLIFSSNSLYPMTVTASRKTTILTMDRELILDICHRSKQFMTAFLREVSDKTFLLTEKINAISRKTIRQCINGFLRQEQYRQGSRTIKLELSKKELAERLGIPRSSLSRELNKMRQDGLVEYDAWTITLKK